MQRIFERGPLSMTLLTHDSERRQVAIVALYPGTATEETVARFIAEARTAALIDSYYVPRVYEVGALPDGAPFVAMEFVAGTDLGEMVAARGGPLPVAVAADVLLQAVDALACARVQGAVHRDLRPGNLVLVSQGDRAEILKLLELDLSPVPDSGNATPEPVPLAPPAGTLARVSRPRAPARPHRGRPALRRLVAGRHAVSHGRWRASVFGGDARRGPRCDRGAVSRGLPCTAS